MTLRRDIKMTVSLGGYPVWCQLHIDGVQVASLHHEDLTDLKHEVTRAMRDARNELPERYKGEV
jgi:hypothetical protein